MTDVVSRKTLYRIARIEYDRHRTTLQPDERGVALLNAAVAQVDDTRDFASWGSLRRPLASRDANDSLIEWAAESVAHFVPLRHIAHPALEPRCVFVSSQHIDHALRLWDEANRPQDNFTVPDSNKWSYVNSISRLQTELLPTRGTAGGKALIDLPHWERIAFILNIDYHWSVLMLIRDESGELTLMHYDSLKGTHVPFVLRLCNLLYATGLLSRDITPVQAATTSTQKGVWECGYAVIARLFEHGVCTFHTENVPLPPMVPRQADVIVRNLASSKPLKSFLTFLQDRCKFSREAEALYKRWDRTYQK